MCGIKPFMRRNAAVLLAACFALWGSLAKADTWGVLIGVSKYKNPVIASLNYPAADASALRDVLTDPTLGHVPADHIKLITDEDATHDNILAAVSGFLKENVKKGDSVIVSLAGHGVAKDTGLEAKSYFLPTDVKGANKTALESSAIDLKQLAADLGKLPASQFVVFVDACREDPTPGRGLKPNSLTDILTRDLQVKPQDTSQQVASATFFACSIGQRAYESPEYKHGVFTYWILEAIKQGNVAVPPDGAIELGRLASFVSSKVTEWADKASKTESLDIEQTPQNTKPEEAGQVILMRVKRTPASAPFIPTPPVLLVATPSEDAQVSINGAKAGKGRFVETKADSGEATVRVEAPGFAPEERKIKVFDGYQQFADFALTGGSAGRTTAGSAADALYQKAQAAEQRQDWEAAQAGYQLTIQSDPKSGAAYERLAFLQTRAGQNGEAIKTLLKRNANIEPDAHAYSLLSHAYTTAAMQDMMSHAAVKEEKKSDDGGGGLFGKVKGIFGGKKKKNTEESDSGSKDQPAGDFRVTENGKEAGQLALKAAKLAVEKDPASAEAQQALGFALIATDSKGANREETIGAFGKAVFQDDKDPVSRYGMGYAYRHFSLFDKTPDERKATLQRAVEVLKTALKLRPNYYEAHRELAFCYHALGQTDDAQQEYEKANANRGEAADKNEVAGINVAQSALYQEKAQNSNGEKKKEYQAASTGYLDDAKDITPDLKQALQILRYGGVDTNLGNYLPGPLRDLWSKASDPFGSIRAALPHIPGLHF